MLPEFVCCAFNDVLFPHYGPIIISRMVCDALTALSDRMRPSLLFLLVVLMHLSHALTRKWPWREMSA